MRSKNLSRYPAEYWTLFRTAVTNGEVRLTLPSKPEAKKFRENLYHYRKALRTANEQLPESESILLARARADRCTISIRGTTVIIHT